LLIVSRAAFENGISDRVPSRLSITTVRARTPRSENRPEPERVAGLKGMFSSARVSSMTENASVAKISMVAMGGLLSGKRFQPKWKPVLRPKARNYRN